MRGTIRRNEALLAMFFFVCLGIILSAYLKITFKDAYFPYYDPYLTKIISEHLTATNVFSYVSEPLFYYITKGLHDITFISYYDIIKYGNLVFIAFLFLVLYFFLTESTSSEKIIDKMFVILAVSYYFLCSYTYRRFSMTLREDLIIIVGFVILLVLARFEKEDVFTIKNASFIAILLAFVIGSHLIVSSVVLGTLIIFLVYCAFKRRIHFVKGLLVAILIAVVISSPFIYVQYFGIAAQFTQGIEFIQERGFDDVTYNWIKPSHFNMPADIVLMLLGAFFFLFSSKLQSNHRGNVVILAYFVAVGVGILISYIPQFGLKPNRFLIYAYLLISFLMIYMLKGLSKNRFTRLIVPVLIGILFATAALNALQYQGYFPINERNVTFIESRLSEIDSYGKIYVGGCAGLILHYLDAKSELISFQDNFQNIPDKLDGPVVMTSDDIASYMARMPLVLERFEELKSLNNPKYDKDARVWILFPD